MEEPTPDKLSFPRAKRRSLVRSAAYRIQPTLRRAVGPQRLLQMLLQVERVAWRLAYEAAGRQYGATFHKGLALTPGTLKAWVPAGARVLDIGCGEGHHARVLADRVGSYLGIDNQPVCIVAAEAAPVPANAAFQIGDARELPTGEFDVVLLVHVLEHIDKPEDLLCEVARLAPTVIVEVPDFDRDILNRARLDLGIDFSSDDDHVREYTAETLEGQLEAAGWRVVDRCRSPMSVGALAERY